MIEHRGKISGAFGVFGGTMLLFLLGLLMVSPAQAAIPANGLYLNSEGSPLIPLLQSVQQSLDIEIYTMKDPEVRSLLRSALARGVKIRIVKEPHPVGEKCDIFGTYGGTDTSADCQDQKALVSEIQNAGGSYVPFNKANLCPNGGGNSGQGCYEHGKIVIADGSTLLLSSGNFDGTNLCIASENPTQCDRDFTMISDDSQLVSMFESLFQADLAGNSYDPRTLVPSSLNQSVTVSPYSLQPLVDFVNSSQSTLEIETQYLDDQQLNQAIVAAARRGVKVSVTVSSLCAFGRPSSSQSNSATATYSEFDNAGISTAMFDSSNTINGASGYLHNKSMIVDGTRAWVGSENGSNESLNENREYGLFFDTAADVQKLQQVIEADHSSPDSETWQESLQCQKDKGGSISSSGEGSDGGVVTHPPKKPKKPKKPRPQPIPDPAQNPDPEQSPDPVQNPDPAPAPAPAPVSTSKPKPKPHRPTHHKKKKKTVETIVTVVEIVPNPTNRTRPKRSPR